ncbi:alpha-1,3-arabinosyltransferase XAT2-like [Dendrobium catenatum]|uniref:alpha-1,3-arabinosyltransferase XAT2-like n=1 Tax=Dendrobium catenatum TaxID=906689 RepID=UPI00109F2103|nr:alpha-1,3-arabinosyltransferase XAT2-like [Dendrobium catenatum]
MGYEKTLARSFRQAEPQKLTFGLLLVCFIVLLTYLSISKPYDAILSAINLKLSSADSALSDLMNKDTMSNVSGKENAIVESKTAGCSNISSKSVHLCQSNVMQRNSSSADISFDLPPLSEGDEVKNIQYFDMAKDEPIINPEKWKSMCDYSNRRSDVCELTGDVRIPINQRSVLLVAKSQSNDSHKIRPYARKSDPSAMSNVAQFTLRLSQINDSPLCTHNHSSPAIVFSVGGYAGNYFHDFSDILLPLFQTSLTFHGKVHFLVSNFRWWWVNKYLAIFQGLSQYEILIFNEADNNSSAIHCFPKAIIGLHSNNDLMLKKGDSMVQFTEFLRRAYLLERKEPIKPEELGVKKPRLLIIARSHTRRFVNLEKIVKMGEKLGFEVLVAEAEGNVVRFARVVNTCDVMMGVHGAGLTNLVFLPTNAVFIQVVPWGKLDWISNTYFKEPAISMKLKYLQYDIKEEESTLMEIYGRDDPVFRDPYSIHKLGWERMKAIYLEKQNVKLNVKRFRGVLVEAMKLLRQR